MIKDFLADEEARDCYISGSAGTGKTTSLSDSVQHCIDNDIKYVVCAYTHKACGILRTKLPPNANVRTLHSFLGKRPCINTNAIKKEQVNQNTKASETDDEPKVLYVDEYSMIGEKDYLDITDAQDEGLKVVWIGDVHQLPPVGDIAAIIPNGPYQIKLTKQWRNDNPLQQPLSALISYMEGTAKPAPLEPVEGYFHRGFDLAENYHNCDADKVILAFTNKRVEELNAQIAGKDEADAEDQVFSPTTQKTYRFIDWVMQPHYIDIHYGDALHLGSKYRTLENLVKSGLCQFALLEDEDGDVWQHAVLFGHYNYKIVKEQLESTAVESNKAIESKHGKAVVWAKSNPKHKLAKARSKAWRECLSFKDCVICIDFPYAMTVHKSQGSTFNTVLVDTDDIAKCADMNFNMYLRLMYVAISRASHRVVTP